MRAIASSPRHGRSAAGFTLLPVILAMSLIAAIAFLLNRDNAITVNLAASQADIERARYAAEAGLQAANYAVQALGCGGSYPLLAAPVTDNNFGGAAYTAYSDRAVGSPMTLTSTGTYNGASVTLNRANVYAYQGTRKAWVLQPDAATGKDTYLDDSNVTRNFGGMTILRLRSARFESLLQFDLAALPAGSRVIPWYDATAGALQPGAKLSIYKTAASAAAVDSIAALLITRTWVEGTKTGAGVADGATWNTYDGTNNWPAPGIGYDARTLSTATYQVALGWQDLDVTDAVVAWMSGVYPNNGVWLRPVGANITAAQNARYHSADAAAVNAVIRPMLVVSYLLPCGAVAPSWFLNPSKDNRLNSASVNQNYGTTTTMILKGPANESRTVLEFDTSRIPSGTVIASAILRMRVTATAGATANPKVINAYAVTEAWVEGTGAAGSGATWNSATGAVNWTTAGGTYSLPLVSGATEEASGLSPPPAAFNAGWLTWNLTALAQAWFDGVTTNNGVIVISTVADQMTIPSGENATAANRPQLVVTY
ncbi:MAG: DNRLRE domain-containing protein [Betaproteobacteria bacterium]|nr:DNRLRE domain-containing protein [Betaproteobacteria bacterium]